MQFKRWVTKSSCPTTFVLEAYKRMFGGSGKDWLHGSSTMSSVTVLLKTQIDQSERRLVLGSITCRSPSTSWICGLCNVHRNNQARACIGKWNQELRRRLLQTCMDPSCDDIGKRGRACFISRIQLGVMQTCLLGLLCLFWETCSIWFLYARWKFWLLFP